jgi:hypothetical protein
MYNVPGYHKGGGGGGGGDQLPISSKKEVCMFSGMTLFVLQMFRLK